jgi:hypothetical protein
MPSSRAFRRNLIELRMLMGLHSWLTKARPQNELTRWLRETDEQSDTQRT